MDIVSLIIKHTSGAVGGNIAGALFRKISLGTLVELGCRRRCRWRVADGHYWLHPIGHGNKVKQPISS